MSQSIHVALSMSDGAEKEMATCATHGAWDEQCTECKVHGVGVHRYAGLMATVRTRSSSAPGQKCERAYDMKSSCSGACEIEIARRVT